MPPKKKGGKKAKGGEPDELNAEQRAALLKMQNDSLRLQLAQRTQGTLRADREKRELQSRVADLRQDFRETADDTFAITADMTRQYKAMEERFMDDINKLESQIQSLKDELAESRVAYEELQAEKDSMVQAKDEEISALKTKMEDMSSEFAEMLQETLQRMAERIEVSATRWEGESSMPVLSRASSGGEGEG